MALRLGKYINSSLIHCKAGKAIIFAACFAALAFMAYAYAPIAKIGSQSTTYTYSDVQEVYSFSNVIAAIAKKNKPAGSRDGVYQALMIAGVEKEILNARKVPQFDRDKATEEIIAQSPYGGLLSREREKIGDERFYRLFILPVVVDKDFGRYYLTKDPNRTMATAAIKSAQQGGLAAATALTGVQAQRSTIPISNETAQLAAEARKSIGSIIPRLVEDNIGYAILQPVEVNDTHIVCDVIFMPRQQISAFIESELKTTKVPVTDFFYSWFRVSRLRESGGVLSVSQVGKKNTAKEGE